MFRRALLTVLLIVLAIGLLACLPRIAVTNKNAAPLVAADVSPAGPHDFRKVSWGMSRQAVMQTERGEPIAADEEMIGFACEAGGKPAHCVYAFVDDRLALGMYQFKGLYSNPNDYFEHFDKLKKMLAEKYRVPLVDEVEWKRTTYKDLPEHWGMAVGAGDLKYRAKWITDRTEILLLLYGNNHDVTLMVRYDSKEFRPLFDKAREQKDRADF